MTLIIISTPPHLRSEIWKSPNDHCETSHVQWSESVIVFGTTSDGDWGLWHHNNSRLLVWPLPKYLFHIDDAMLCVHYYLSISFDRRWAPLSIRNRIFSNWAVLLSIQTSIEIGTALNRELFVNSKGSSNYAQCSGVHPLSSLALISAPFLNQKLSWLTLI